MANSTISINPTMRVGDLLVLYPELEETLIACSPVFVKLRNPLLRKTIARVATLKQASVVAGINEFELVNKLRIKAGQAEITEQKNDTIMTQNKPEWLNNATITETLDARDMLARGEHPLTSVLEKMHNFEAGNIFLLVTPFKPAPLIEKVTATGAETYTDEPESGVFHTYFRK